MLIVISLLQDWLKEDYRREVSIHRDSTFPGWQIQLAQFPFSKGGQVRAYNFSIRDEAIVNDNWQDIENLTRQVIYEMTH